MAEVSQNLVEIMVARVEAERDEWKRQYGVLYRDLGRSDEKRRKAEASLAKAVERLETIMFLSERSAEPEQLLAEISDEARAAVQDTRGER